MNSVAGYQYKALGQLAGITYPSGKTVSYRYADGRVDQVSSNGGVLVDQATYNAANQVTGWRWASGTLTQRSYDQDGRLIRQSLAGQERSLTYDWIGNLLSINDGLDLHSYGYDPMSRLVSSSDYNLSYAYDRNGNRLTANSSTAVENYSYNPAGNQLAAVQGGVVKNYRYDETGNTLSDGTHNYRYDGKNQLAEITGVAFYLYNGLGQRTAKNSSGILTHYVYDEKARLIGEYNATGLAIQETVYLFGQPIAVLKGADVYAVHTDHLGSPRKITNPSGNTVWQWQDKPFGDSPVNQDPDGDGVAFEYNLRFPGQYFDAETGLHYNHYRYYDPQIGRYLTSDPIGLAGGMNTYTYVRNNPLKYTDRLGLLVDAILDRSSNTLTVTDQDTGASIAVSAFTGGHVDADGTITSPGYTADEVSAPNGVYSITNNPNVKPGHEDWFGIIRQDDRIDDYFTDGGSIRSGIRLHMGQTSWGCATVNQYSPGADHNWVRIKDLISNTSTSTLDFRSGPHWYNGTDQLTNYGTLTIK